MVKVFRYTKPLQNATQSAKAELLYWDSVRRVYIPSSIEIKILTYYLY